MIKTKHNLNFYFFELIGSVVSIGIGLTLLGFLFIRPFMLFALCTGIGFLLFGIYMLHLWGNEDFAHITKDDKEFVIHKRFVPKLRFTRSEIIDYKEVNYRMEGIDAKRLTVFLSNGKRFTIDSMYVKNYKDFTILFKK